MFNLLRMDLYRIKRSLSVYICLAIMLSISVLGCWMIWLLGTPEGRQSAVNSGMIETELLMEELEDESNLLEGMDLLEMYRNMSMDGGFYPCIICIITSLFVCADFQSGFIKNIMSSHRNRWRYVVSKLLTMGIVNFFFTMISFGFCFLTNALFHMVPFTNWLDVLFYLGWAWVITTAFSSLIIAICIFTRNGAISILAAIIFSSGLLVTVLSALSSLFHLDQWVTYTLYFNMTYGPSSYSGIGDLRIFGIGLAFLVLYTLIASIVLSKKDI